MRETDYRVTFSPDHGVIHISALGEEQAVILAQAQRIKSGLAYKDFIIKERD